MIVRVVIWIAGMVVIIHSIHPVSIQIAQSRTIVAGKFFRHVQTLCMALRIACNSPVHSNTVINYAIAIRLF